MTASFHRRGLLLSAAALAATAAACGGPVSADLALSELADGLFVISGAGGNIVAARGPDGGVLIDGGRAETAGDVIRAARRALGVRTISTLVNTHWHPEQTGGNAAIAAQGAAIAAQESTRLWLGTTIYQKWSETTFPPAPVEARPTRSFYKSETMDLGGEVIELAHQRGAHTDGDLYVRFPKSNVIAAGGIVTGAGWPILDWSTGGWLGGMIDGIQKLVDISDEATRIVPADGPVIGKTDLERQLAMYTTIMDRMREDLRASLGPEEVAARKPTAEFDAEMGDPSQFVILAFESLWLHLRSDMRVRAI